MQCEFMLDSQKNKITSEKSRVWYLHSLVGDELYTRSDLHYCLSARSNTGWDICVSLEADCRNIQLGYLISLSRPKSPQRHGVNCCLYYNNHNLKICVGILTLNLARCEIFKNEKCYEYYIIQYVTNWYQDKNGWYPPTTTRPNVL